jgi:predicted negative regulator of RcsB-dependent stress response
MSKYNRKKENPALATTDEFVGFWQKAFERVRPFARAIGWSLAGFVVVVGVFAAFQTWSERRAEGATEAFGRAVRIYENDLAGELPKPGEKPEASEHADDLPKYKTAKERAEATLSELGKLPPAAAKNAKLFRAGVLYDLERYDEARQAYAEAARGAAPEVGAIAREGEALCLEQLGKVDEAVAAYDQIAPRGDKATEFYRDRALMGAARLLEKKDKAQAIERYKEVIAKFNASPLREDAQNRLAVLEAK